MVYPLPCWLPLAVPWPTAKAPPEIVQEYAVEARVVDSDTVRRS
ncbi:hypothetical protein [Falsirhodobacter sp. 1013]